MQYQHTGRRLRGNASVAIPRYVLCYDAETMPRKDNSSGRSYSHTLRLACATTARIVNLKPVGVKHYRLRTKEDFWNLVESLTAPNYTVWIVAHNTLFDMVVSGMAEQFEQAKVNIEWPRSVRRQADGSSNGKAKPPAFSIDSPPTIIPCKLFKTNGRFVILDTLNYFQAPLSDLGKACGKPKLPMPRFDDSDEKWFEYCERDTEIVFDTFLELIRWVRLNDMGMFRYTAPSQAMSAFRHRFCDHEILMHDNTDAKATERAAYFGGRSEVFKMGEIHKTVHNYDCNALFPYVMHKHEFPSCLNRFEQRGHRSELFPSIDWSRSVAEVELHTWESIYPKRTERGVLYPVGTFETTLCGLELENAYRSGIIRKVGSWCEYRTEPLFRRWVEELWTMREKYKREGNELYCSFVKMLMNSFYGKWAQLSAEWQTQDGNLADLPWASWAEVNMATGEKTSFRSFGWQVQKLCSKTELPKTFVAISAFVTAAARSYMNEIRSVIGLRDCYYQGVDGVIITDKGRERLNAVGLVSDSKIGFFKHVLSANYGEINGISDYRLGDKVVLSGTPRDRSITEMATQLQRTFHVKGNLFRGGSVYHVTEQLSEFHRSVKYWKGNVNPNGWVAPIRLGIGT